MKMVLTCCNSGGQLCRRHNEGRRQERGYGAEGQSDWWTVEGVGMLLCDSRDELCDEQSQ